MSSKWANRAAEALRCCSLTGVRQSAGDSGEMARETPCGDVEHWAWERKRGYCIRIRREWHEVTVLLNVKIFSCDGLFKFLIWSSSIYGYSDNCVAFREYSDNCAAAAAAEFSHIQPNTRVQLKRPPIFPCCNNELSISTMEAVVWLMDPREGIHSHVSSSIWSSGWQLNTI